MRKLKTLLSCVSKTLFLAVIGQFITHHGKRILFIMSLYCQFSQRNVMTKELLDKLNEALRLASDKNALLLPARYYHFFWDQDRLKEKLRECGVDGICDIDNGQAVTDIDKVSNGIVDITPQWLRYGRREDMVKDLKDMLALQFRVVNFAI